MGDPVFDFFDSGGKSAVPPPMPSAAKSSSNDPVYDFLVSGGKSVSSKPAAIAPSPVATPVGTSALTPEDDSGPLPGVLGHAVTGIGASIIGGWRGLATLATGGTLDDAANAVHEETQNRTYQPEAGSSAAKALDVLDSPANPLTWIPRGAKKAGEFAQDLGASPGVATAVEAGINAAPLLFGLKGGAAEAGTAGEAALRARIEPMLRTEPIVKETALPEPEIRSPLPNIGRSTEPTFTPESLQAAQNLVEAKAKAMADWTTTIDARKAAMSDPNASVSVLRELAQKSAEAEKVYRDLGNVKESVTPTGTTEAPRFSEATDIASAEGKGLPQPEQLNRARLLNRLGIETTRKSAISGDVKAASTDFQTSLLDSPEGKLLHDTLQGERQALHGYAERLVHETGGTVGTDSSALYGRGNTILEPLDNLNQWFNKQTSALYKDADARSGGQPVDLPKTLEFVGGDQAEFLGTTEGESLLKGIQARMKSLGLVDKEGNPQPVTVKQAEQLKQYLNNQWQPRTSRLISGLKNAIDDDVFQNAGADIYKKARGMRAMKAAVFENDLLDAQGRTIPNGIGKIVDANGKNIELLKDTEKIADTVTALPADQFGQIVKTLQNVPTELQPQAEAALAEIKAHFANKILDAGAGPAGQWGAKGVTKYLKGNGERMRQIFTPEEMASFNDLNEGGHILAQGQRYPGAEVQKQNLLKSGALKLMGPAGAGIAEVLTGGLTGGAAGAGGAFIGNRAAGAIEGRSSFKAAQQRLIKLRDLPGIND